MRNKKRKAYTVGINHSDITALRCQNRSSFENQVGYVGLVWHTGAWSSYQVDFPQNKKNIV